MADPLLSVRDLVVEFPTRRGTLRALDRVSFDIMPGEVLGMVGESGAGKSITGAAIIGLIEPPGRVASGEIRLKGERIDNLRPEALRKIRGKRIGMVFQDPLTSLNPLYTVAQQLIETIRTHIDCSEAEARKRAVALLDRVGIPAAARRIDDYPHHFSGGMRQRVVIALALCAEPELVIADEPTTALDVTIQAQILDLMRNLQAEYGAAIILITHDLGVVAEMANRIAVMYAGQIVEEAATSELFDNPRHPYTQGLIASIPVLGEIKDELEVIPGNVPNLIDLPPGCRFAPRCRARVAHNLTRCTQDMPELIPVGVQHVARCWLYE